MDDLPVRGAQASAQFGFQCRGLMFEILRAARAESLQVREFPAQCRQIGVLISL